MTNRSVTGSAALPDLVADYIAGRIAHSMFAKRFEAICAQQDYEAELAAEAMRERIGRLKRLLRVL